MTSKDALLRPMAAARPKPESPILPLAAVAMTAVGFGVLWARGGTLPTVVTLVGALTAAATGGPWLIRLVARLALRRESVTSLAGHRLLADVRSSGRVAAGLLVAGLAFSVLSRIGGDELDQVLLGDGFSSGGLTALVVGTAAVLVVTLIATASLAVGAIRPWTDGRLSDSDLRADHDLSPVVQQVVRRQLLLAAVPAVVIGVFSGWSATWDFGIGRVPDGSDAVALLVAVLGAALAATAGVLLADQVLCRSAQEAVTPQVEQNS